MPQSRQITAALIDDSATDRARLVEKLAEPGDLQVVPFAPPFDMDVTEILATNPDALIVDYQLNEAQPGHTPATYKGSTLAAALRERLPDVPIVLLTRGSLFRGDIKSAARDASQLYDELLFKEDVYADPEPLRQRLRYLVKGFDILRRDTAGWDPVIRAMHATPREFELLKKAEPPQDLLSDQDWRVPEVARWVRSVVLRYPGIVYSPLYAATSVGLSLDSFGRAEIQAFFAGAAYDGVFCPEEGRWWSERLIARALFLLQQAGTPDLAPTYFGSAWEKLNGQRLAPAMCNTSGQSPADSVCVVLNSPVLQQYSLPYSPDARPTIMDQARVSFRAIRESNAYDERLFPSDVRSILDEIERGDWVP